MGNSASIKKSIKDIKEKSIKEKIKNPLNLNDRLNNYNKTTKILEKGVELCNFRIFQGAERIKHKQIGSVSENGIVYKVDDERLPRSIVGKVMLNNESSQKESAYYSLFRNDVLNGKTPHFPLTWNGKECGKCPFLSPEKIAKRYSNERGYDDYDEVLKAWTYIRNKKCYLLFTELFDGDLSHLVKQGTEEELTDRFLSMLAQVTLGLYTMSKKGLAHNDLHVGNILHLSIGGEEKYFTYKIGKDTVQLRHFNILHVLWDFDLSSKKDIPIPSAYTDEYFIENGYFSEPLKKRMTSSFMFDMFRLLGAFLNELKIERKECEKLYRVVKGMFDIVKKTIKKGEYTKINIYLFMKNSIGKMLGIYDPEIGKRWEEIVMFNPAVPGDKDVYVL